MMAEEINVDRKTVMKTSTKVMSMREGSVEL
jgi:predicted regulator of amino acid metabolism with ACT domain